MTFLLFRRSALVNFSCLFFNISSVLIQSGKNTEKGAQLLIVVKHLAILGKKPLFCHVRKNIFIGLLIIPILFQTLNKFSLLLYYEVNKTFITERFCINKDKPMKMCSGKCYLFSELQQQQEEDQGEKIPLKLLQENQISCFVVECPEWNFSAQSIDKKPLLFFDDSAFLAQSFFIEIFHPPRVV